MFDLRPEVYRTYIVAYFTIIWITYQSGIPVNDGLGKQLSKL